MKPLILHMRACNFFGGPERQIIGHIKHSSNFDHFVLTFADNGSQNELAENCRKEGIPYEIIASKSAYDPSSILRLRKILKKKHPNIICSHGYRPTILSIISKAGLHIPLIVFSRGHTGEDKKVRFFETLERAAYRFADCIVAVSNGYANHLKKSGLVDIKIKVVQNAIDPNRIDRHLPAAYQKRAELGFNKDDFLIATAGRLSPEKAQNDLITAFAAIQPVCLNTHLLLMGDGPSRAELQKLVQQEKVDNVHFLGFRQDMDEIMCAIDLFVLASHTEGLPNVILEAFAAKKPVVATAVGGVPEVVNDGVSGYLVQAQKPDMLAEALKKSIEGRENLAELGEAGFQKIKFEFMFDSQTEKIERIYQDLLPISKLSL